MPNFEVKMQDHSMTDTLLKVGDKVTYTNEYGVSFPGQTVTGFPIDADSAEKVFIDSDSYWCPKPINSLTIEEQPNFMFYEHYDLSATHLVERAAAYSKPISQADFEQFMTEATLAAGRIIVAKHYRRIECEEHAATFATAEYKNPRIGISNGTVGRNEALTLLVELGEELVAFDAGKAWAHLVKGQ